MKVLVSSRVFWWVNFVNESVEFFSIINVNNALKPYGGRYSITYKYHTTEMWLEFESEEQYTWFLLRFS